MNQNNQVDVLKLSPRDYKDHINSIFSICTRAKMTEIDKDKLVNFYDIRNYKGYSILYYYLLKKGNDVMLIEKMLQNHHHLNNNDYYDIFKELFTNHYNTNRFNKEKSKIFWIIDNISRIGVDKKKFTKMILEDFFQINLKIEYSFELVKYLDGKNLLDKTGQYNFNPLMYFHDLDKWKWFDNHFQIDWKNLDVKKSYPRPAYNIFNRLLQNNWFQLTKEKADFLLSKDPNFVKNNIVDKNFNLNSNHFLKNLYQLFDVANFKPSFIALKWQQFVQNKLSSTTSIYLVNIFLFGLLNNEIKEIPLGIIKLMNLNLDLIKTYIKNGKIDEHTGITFNNKYNSPYQSTISFFKKYKKNPCTLFLEDLRPLLPNKTDSQIKANYIDCCYVCKSYNMGGLVPHFNNYQLLTKDQCIQIKKEIEDHLKIHFANK